MTKISGFVIAHDPRGSSVTISYIPKGETNKITVDVYDENGFAEVGDLIVAKPLSTRINSNRYKILEIIEKHKSE